MTRTRICAAVALITAASAIGSVIQVGPRLYEVTEMRVNTTAQGSDWYPSIAVLTDGAFMVGWDHGAPTDCWGRRFSADGVPVGNEFLLNPHNTGGWEYGPEMAPLPGGGFAVVFGDSSTTINVQIFDGSMNPVGTDTVVGYENVWPTISSAPNGDFVVTGGRAPNEVKRVFARRYNAAGVPYGPMWQVNSTPLDFVGYADGLSAVAHGHDGRFVVAWYHGSGEIRAQLYDSSGAPLGGEFTVNSSVGGARKYPTVDFTGPNEFIVAWQGYGEDDDQGIFARAFAADGTPTSEEWMVNQITGGVQRVPHLGAGPTGEFVISWVGDDNSGSGVIARLFSSVALPVGDQFQVNQFTVGDQVTSEWAGRRGTAINGSTLFFSWWGNSPGDSQGIGLTQFHYAGEIPEPATVTLFGIAVAAMLRRRKRRA